MRQSKKTKFLMCVFLCLVFVYLSQSRRFLFSKDAYDHHDSSESDSPEISRTRKQIELHPTFGQLPDPDNWSPPRLPDSLQNAEQDDPRLIRHIRQHWIIPPSKKRLRIQTNPRTARHSQYGQPEFVYDLLGKIKNGFMIECGAGDGERHSNSLYFELKHKWSGILIEPNPDFFVSILQKRRHMYSLNACLSTDTKPMMVNFTFAGISGGISDFLPVHQKKLVKVSNVTPVLTQCFPLYSILAAMNVSHVHYFSLDIEGPEVVVLKTIPLDEIRVDVFSIEKRVLGDEVATAKKERDIVRILEKYGYATEKVLKLDLIMSKL